MTIGIESGEAFGAPAIVQAPAPPMTFEKALECLCVTAAGHAPEAVLEEAVAKVRAHIKELQATANRSLETLELAWGVIANAGGGDWSKESVGWITAALMFRDNYEFELSARLRRLASAPSTPPLPGPQNTELASVTLLPKPLESSEPGA